MTRRNIVVTAGMALRFHSCLGSRSHTRPRSGPDMDGSGVPGNPQQEARYDRTRRCNRRVGGAAEFARLYYEGVTLSLRGASIACVNQTLPSSDF